MERHEDDILLEDRLRRAALRGDQEAWRALYLRAFDPLWRFVLRQARGDVDRAEDVVQESWMIAVRRLADFAPECGSFEVWLRGIAANVLRNDRRRRGRRHSKPLQDDLAAPPPRNSVGQQIEAALAGLPARQRDVLREKYENEATVAELASLRGETEKTVESLLSRARAAFRRCFRGGDI